MRCGWHVLFDERYIIKGSALAFLFPFVGAGLTTCPGIQLYICSAHDTNRVGHFYSICVLIFNCLLDDGEKSIVNVHIGYGRSLEVRDIAVLFTPILRFLLRHLSILFITLIAHDDEGEALGILCTRMINKALPPFLNLLKRFPLS